ncbi:autophagy-related protein 18 [Tilletiopsis washingtonensis]|uniref:Autophagy-related protein 18 n=1 Tax=Tilletiopsis washingtonensis TaxID=58919 RepID=A0A316Z7L1_9BASI|nr:autophagy-related protein 18 [Tilletiopsis washingtonensis]PWN96215.1 autophagy-related protein 18 [Tilletiopsis washingtonensis]
MAAPKSAPALLSVSFNQDSSCISVGTRKGYAIANAEPFGRIYARDDGPTAIVEMLFCTSLVALVGTADSSPQSSPRRLQIVNTKRQSTICELLFPTSILAVKLNRRRLVVVLEEEIYIYDISNMKLLHTIETSPNPQAICALSPSSEPCYLAYPSPVPSPTSPFSNTAGASSSTPGDVLIFDLLSLSVSNIIQAHKAPISCLALNSTGTLLATSSEKGTVIRVFSVPGAQKLYQFRRGSYPARIYNISFNAVSTLLCVSSDTETVHIFKLAPQVGAGARPSIGAAGNGSSPTPSFEGSEASSAGQGGYEAFISDKKKGGGLSGTLKRRSMAVARAAGGMGSFLNSHWEPSRDFAYLKLPSAGVSSVVAVSSTTPQVLVATSEGFFYSYNIDLESGGECTLTRQFSLLEGEDSSNGAASTMD